MTYMSTAERLVKLHDTMCENIEAMGGTVDPTGTLIEIAGAILDIPPVPVGVSIDTATTCSADKATTTVSSPVTFTGKVSAYHDDETSANVDLIGYLKGATVKFYNGQTLLGSTTTDNNGEYSFSYTPLVAGEMSVIAMFEAIEDYKQSSSTAVVITVSSYSDIVMSADKPILSYADGDKATLYAQLVDDNDAPLAIEGVTLTFKKDSTILGTANTDSTGLATLVDGYTSQGVGDVTLSVTDGTFLTKTYSIEDVLKYDSGTSDKTSSYDTTYSTNQTFTYDSTNSAYKVKRTATGFGAILVPNLNVPKNVEISVDTKLYHSQSSNNNTQIRLGLWNELNKGIGAMIGFYQNQKFFRVHNILITDDDSPSQLITDDSLNIQQNTWYRLVLRIEDGTITFSAYDTNNTLLKSCTGTTSKFTTNNNTVGLQTLHMTNAEIYFKNLKIKPL